MRQLIEQRRTGWDFDTTGEPARIVTVQPGFALIRLWNASLKTDMKFVTTVRY
jgi:hypothetical protein